MCVSKVFTFLDRAQRFDEGELVFHYLIRNLEAPMHLRNDLSHSPCKCFPLLLLSLLPMVGPEIIIWFEHGHIGYFAGIKGRQTRDQLVFHEAGGVGARLEHGRPPFYGYGFDGMQVEEGALLELNQLSSVGCASFREDVKNGHLTSLVLQLPFLNGAHRVCFLLAG